MKYNTNMLTVVLVNGVVPKRVCCYETINISMHTLLNQWNNDNKITMCIKAATWNGKNYPKNVKI